MYKKKKKDVHRLKLHSKVVPDVLFTKVRKIGGSGDDDDDENGGIGGIERRTNGQSNENGGRRGGSSISIVDVVQVIDIFTFPPTLLAAPTAHHN